MRTLAHSARRTKDAGGEFLPSVLAPLDNMGMKIRRGTVTFIAGPPGSMKTAVALYLTLRMNRPTIYFSADAEDFEVVERAAAMISGDTMAQVRANPENYTEHLDSVSNVRFVFEDSPTYDNIDDEVAAYLEVFGRPPEVLVIDNLMNVVGDNENEWASMRDSARYIHRLTRITKAGVLVLHHMADDRADPTTPAPRSKLQGKIGQLPKAIWSLALNGDELRVAPVKNRWHAADASGSTWATVYVDAERSRFFNSRAALMTGQPA